MFYHKIYIIFHFCSFPSAFFILRNSRHNMLIKRFHLTKLKRHSSSSKIKLQTLTTIQIKSSFFCLCCKNLRSFVLIMYWNSISMLKDIKASFHSPFATWYRQARQRLCIFSVTFELKFNAPKSLKLLKRQHFSYSINIGRLFKRHTMPLLMYQVSLLRRNPRHFIIKTFLIYISWDSCHIKRRMNGTMRILGKRHLMGFLVENVMLMILNFWLLQTTAGQWHGRFSRIRLPVLSIRCARSGVSMSGIQRRRNHNQQKCSCARHRSSILWSEHRGTRGTA